MAASSSCVRGRSRSTGFRPSSGSSIKTRFELRDGRPVLFRLPEVNFIDDKAGKPVGINEHIGRRPIAAFGNSDGDLEMLQWTTMAGGPCLGLIVHHTDAERECTYDRQPHFGRLDKALVAAAVAARREERLETGIAFQSRLIRFFEHELPSTLAAVLASVPNRQPALPQGPISA